MSFDKKTSNHQRLFHQGLRNKSTRSYGSIVFDDEFNWRADRTSDSKNIKSPLKSPLKLISPHIWPKNNRILQFDLVVCVLLFLVGRLLNLLVPIYTKLIVNCINLSSTDDDETNAIQKIFVSTLQAATPCRDYIFIWIFLKILQGSGTSGGLLRIFTTFLWIPVQQHISRNMKVTFFNHLHKLSPAWHTTRDCTEDTLTIEIGTESVNKVLQYVLFVVIPAGFDILLAIVYFILFLNYIFGVILGILVIFYLSLTIFLTRRNMTKSNVSHFRIMRSQEFETMLHNNKFKAPAHKYFSVDVQNNLQDEEYKFILKTTGVYFLQTIIFGIGFGIGTLLCAAMTAKGMLSVGDFVLFLIYMMQISDALGCFGQIYVKLFHQNMEMDNMFALLNFEPQVRNFAMATNLDIPRGGSLVFRNVSFSYTPGVQIIKNLSFNLSTDRTIAFVGASMTLSSAIVDLLFRDYDPIIGEIIINGQNIKHYTLESLREHIGLVSRSNELLNETIEYNIQYGQIGSSTLEVVNAAKEANIHDQIMTMADRYETKVGRHGLYLSPCDRLSISIARVLLKDPPIVVLNNVTCSTNNETIDIRRGLKSLCVGRTCVILEKVPSEATSSANLILVIRDGQIVQRGTHKELLRQENKLYRQLWNDAQNTSSR